MPSNPPPDYCAEEGSDFSAVSNGHCCCAFWSPSETDKPRAARDLSCSQKFSVVPSVNRSAAGCRFAIALSGFIEDPATVPCVLEGIETHLQQNRSEVCAVAHVEVAAEQVDAVAQALASKPWIVDYAVESSDDPAVSKSVASCTAGAFDTFLKYAHAHENPLLDPNLPCTDCFGKSASSFMSMHRKVWLANGMVRSLNVSIELVARLRMDLTERNDYKTRMSRDDGGLDRDTWEEERLDLLAQGSPLRMNWEDVKRRAAGETRRVLVQDVLGRQPQRHNSMSRGVPVSLRCWVDDEFAIGPPELMEDYSSLYPDFQMMLPLLPIHSPVLQWATSERLLANHLHLRGVPFDTTIEIPYKVGHRIRQLCDPPLQPGRL